MSITSYTFIGTSTGERAGVEVSAAGDFDGDGVADVFIGARGLGGFRGGGYLVSAADLASADAADGSVDGVIELDNVAPQSDSYQFIGEIPGDSAGLSFATIGDVDSDGLDDFVIGAPDAGAALGSPGQAYVIAADDLFNADIADGLADGVIDLGNVAAQSGSFELQGLGLASGTGSSIASGGDIDGDGQNEILIGAPFLDTPSPNAGGVFLLDYDDLSVADGDDGLADGVVDLGNTADEPGSYTFLGDTSLGRAGNDVTFLGDVDDDGIGDFFLTQPSTQLGGVTGRAYLVSGSDLVAADNADGSADGVILVSNIAGEPGSYEFTSSDLNANNGLGNTVAASDVDGDGTKEVFLGSFNDSGYLIDFESVGDADVADGLQDGLVDLINIVGLDGSYELENSPFAGAPRLASSAGDFDGDGKEDLLIGSPFLDGGTIANPTDSGAFLVSGADLSAADAADGSADGVIDYNSFAGIESSYILEGPVPVFDNGVAISTAGDVDGDGLDDLLIGALTADPNGTTDAGQAFLLSAQDLASADDDGTGQDTFISLANIFFDDVVEGTSGDDVIDRFYLGDPELDQVDNNDNAAGTNDDVIEAGDGEDTIVASEGDDDIDGGADRDTYVSGDIGASYTFLGANAGDAAGLGVSSAGDVDGDGLDDIFIASPAADGGATTAGEIYLVSGAELAAADAADGFVDNVIDLDNVNEQGNSYQFLGIDDSDFAGSFISSAGDVDGDGREDLLIGVRSAIASGSMFSRSGETFLVTADALEDADNADGSLDGVIDLANVAGVSGSYRIVGAADDRFFGFGVASAGDVDGDGLDDLLIGAPESEPSGTLDEGTSYLITAADLADIDMADGLADGVINTDRIAGQGGSYEFVGGNFDEEFGFSVDSLGDIDGDGFDDLLIGSREADFSSISGDEGAAYILSGSELADLDAEDGLVDGVIDVTGAVGEPGITQFVGDSVSDVAGTAVANAGDVDGDGITDFLVGAPEINGGSASNTGGAYLVSGAEIATIDGADGFVDGRVELANVPSGNDSYLFVGKDAGDQVGYTLDSAGDIDGDGLADLLIGGLFSDEVYLIAAADLAAADLEDGSLDGVINLENVEAQSSSYVFVAVSSDDLIASEVKSAGDVDGDGIGDLLIGAPRADGGGLNSGETYLISGGDLEALDAVDGTTDGVIQLGLVAAIDDTVTVNVNEVGDGTSQGTYVTGLDTLTSVESFVAGENADEADAITISHDGSGFVTSDISGIDNLAVGIFTPDNGDPPVAFGPGGGPTFSDIVSQIENGPYFSGGTFQISDGDETGQLGDISFQNFESITFNIVCFARGTTIATKRGSVQIENLSVGDAVMTMDHGCRPIRWIGSCKLDATSLALKPKLKPIRIRQGALGNGVPMEDLYVSPQHRVLIQSVVAERMFGEREVLIAANKLLALDGFEVVEDCMEVEYFHMLFDQHEIVFSNGAPTESLFTGQEALKAVTPAAREEILALFPEMLSPEYERVSARLIPEKGGRMRSLAARHQKNDKPLIEVAM